MVQNSANAKDRRVRHVLVDAILPQMINNCTSNGAKMLQNSPGRDEKNCKRIIKKETFCELTQLGMNLIPTDFLLVEMEDET